MLKVIDRWTTQYGSWDVNSSSVYGIDKAHKDKYFSGRDIPGAGGDHNIFVRVPKGTGVVEFNTADGKNKNEFSPHLWINFPIFEAYNPDTEQGAWLVRIDGEKVAEGIGLPHGLHVSTFLVVEAVEVEPPLNPEPIEESYLVIKGVEVWRK